MFPHSQVHSFTYIHTSILHDNDMRTHTYGPQWSRETHATYSFEISSMFKDEKWL
jgi:hypothetical protein